MLPLYDALTSYFCRIFDQVQTCMFKAHVCRDLFPIVLNIQLYSLLSYPQIL